MADENITTSNGVEINVIPIVDKEKGIKSVDDFAKRAEKVLEKIDFNKVISGEKKIRKNQGRFRYSESTNTIRELVRKEDQLFESIYKKNRKTKKWSYLTSNAIDEKQVKEKYGIDIKEAVKAENAKQKAILKEKEKQQLQLQKIQDETLKKQWSREWQTDYMMPNLGRRGQLQLKLQMAKEDVKDLENEFMTLKMSNAPEKQLKDISNRLKDAQKQVNKLDKASRLGGLEKLWNTFKRIGFYRIFRGIFAGIAQGYKEGMDYLIAFDKEANNTMSSLSSSYDKIKASVAVSLLPIMEAFAPMLEIIANTFSNFANNISIASAQMKGLSKYTKVNEEYMKDLATEAQGFLASFDKFESLNGKTSPFTTGDMADLTDEEIEKAKKFQETIESIKQFLTDVFNIGKSVIENIDWGSLAESLSEVLPVLADIFTKLVNTFSKIVTWLSDMGLLTPVLWGVAAALIAIKLIGAPLKAGLIIGAVTAGVALIASLSNNSGHITSTASGVIGNNSSYIADTPTYKPSTSEVQSFNGNDNSNGIKNAMVEAIYETQDVFHQDSGEVVLNVDGAEIARSKRFKTELNRTNSELNLR